MLKPTFNKDYCWHNVSQRTALRQLPAQSADSSSSLQETHTDYDGPSHPGFGDAYYERLSQLVDKHLQLATDDRVCYVGDVCGAQVVPVLIEQYCLVKPVTRIIIQPYRVRSLLTCSATRVL